MIKPTRNASASRIRPWLRGAFILLAVVLLVGMVASSVLARHYRVLLPEGESGLTLIRRESLPGPHARIMVVAPHPDDETLGGEVALRDAVHRHLPARVILMTCGDGFVAAARRQFGHKPTPQDMVRFGFLRHDETLHACRAIGLKDRQVAFLGFPDGGTGMMWTYNWTRNHPFRSSTTGMDHVPYPFAAVPSATYCGETLLAELETQIRVFQPTDIYVSYAWDDHTDHAAANYYVTAALDDLRGYPFARSVHLHPYLVHCGVYPRPRGYWPTYFVDPPMSLRVNDLPWSELRLTPGQTVYRKNIIDLYQSQVALTAPFLEAFARQNVLYGDVPAFPARAVTFGPRDPAHWARGDRCFLRGDGLKQAGVHSADVVYCPGGLLLRLHSELPATNTICRVFLHPLESHARDRIASLATGAYPIPTSDHAPLVGITVDGTGHPNLPGVVRRDRAKEITIFIPDSLFSGAQRVYLGARLVRDHHELRALPWRLIALPASVS